jgi:hypothetical protein
VSIRRRSTLFIALLALVSLASLLTGRADAYNASSTQFENHWELLGKTVTSSAASAVNIARGSLPLGTTSFDPAPTATLEVVAKVTGATGSGGWTVDVFDSDLNANVARVTMTASDTAFSIKTGAISWPTLATHASNLEYLILTPKALGGANQDGTITINKAYIKLHQGGPIKKIAARTPIANNQDNITGTAWAEVADPIFFTYREADYNPLPTVTLRAGGKATGVSGQGTVRLVNGRVLRSAASRSRPLRSSRRSRAVH